MRFKPLKKQKDILRVLKSGKKRHTATLTAIFMPAEEAKYAVCVGKKYGKSAARNRIKRLLREAFRVHAKKFQTPCLVLLLPKVSEEYSFAEFERDIGIAVEKEVRSNA